MKLRERRDGEGTLLLVQPELSKPCSFQSLGVRSGRGKVWVSLAVKKPSLGLSPACRHCLLPPRCPGTLGY